MSPYFSSAFWLFLGVLLLLQSLLVSASEFDFTVSVEAQTRHCFFQPVTDEKYVSMEIDYQVIDGGDLNINFMVSLGDTILKQDHMKSDGSHKIDVAAKGDYQICLDNTFSYQQRKVVFFEIFLYDKEGNLEDLDFDTLAHNKLDKAGFENYDNFVTSVTALKGKLNKVEYYQSLWRGWEARDRAVMNANLDRVNTWSIINAVVMMGVGLCQVYMIRSLFEENSRLGQVLRRNKT